MAVSNDFDFSITRNTLIDRALTLSGVYSSLSDIPAEDYSMAADFLNMLLRHYDTTKHLWTTREGTLFLAKEVSEYTLSSDSSSARWADNDNVVETKLNGAHLISATSLTVDSTVGMTAADNIGVVIAGNDTFWDTIVSVDSSTTLTITNGLSAAASDNANVYTYTSRAERPLRIEEMGIRRRSNGGSDSLMACEPRKNFMALSNKSSLGTPTVWYYDPQRTAGILYLYQTPNTTADRLKITYQRRIQNFVSSSDNPELPEEWYLCLVYGLACYTATAFGKLTVLQVLYPMYQQLHYDLLGHDAQVGPITFVSPRGKA